MSYLSGAIGDSDSSNVDGYLIRATDRDLYLDEMLMNDRTFGNRDPARDPAWSDILDRPLIEGNRR